MDDLILDDEQLPEFMLFDASKAKRLANFLLDFILFYIALFAFFFVVGFSMVSSGGVVNDDELVINLLVLAWYFIYFGVSEWYFKGRTPAKFITKTRAVNMDGTFPSAQKTMLRALCRLIPLLPIVYLFSDSPWHDSLTQTRVVDWPKP
jgi:uncharacterized RDD family membrane protein YckC